MNTKKYIEDAGRPSVLVVDDESAIRNFMRRMLEDSGYATVTVPSGELCLELLREREFAVVLCDYRLEGMDGIETISRAKEIQPSIGSVLMTGHGSEQTIVDAFTLGKVDYYLTKPFNTSDIQRLVSHALKAFEVRKKEREFNEELKRKVEEAVSELRYKNDLLEQQKQHTAQLNDKLREDKKRLKELNEQLEHLSITDGLTGLYNHRHFSFCIEGEFRRAKRYNSKLSLLMADIDDFKKVNDEYGHLAGDEVLQKVAEAMQASSRDIDVAARYGGEEFVMILPEAGMEGATAMAERLRQRIADISMTFGDKQISITVSIGVSSFNAAIMECPEDIIRAADNALYFAKGVGKNCVAISMDGECQAPGRDAIISDEQKNRIQHTLLSYSSRPICVDEILTFLARSVHSILGGAENPFYVSVWLKDGKEKLRERVSINEYHGHNDINDMATRAIRDGKPKISDTKRDPFACFPICCVDPENDENFSPTGVLLMSRIPPDPAFIQELLNETAMALGSASVTEKLRAQLERRRAQNTLLSRLAADSVTLGVYRALLEHKDKINSVLRFDRFSVYTYNPVSGEFECGFRTGSGVDTEETTHDNGFVAKVAENLFKGKCGEPMIMENAVGGAVSRRARFIMIPIKFGEEPVGVIVGEAFSGSAQWGEDDIEMVSSLAPVLALAMRAGFAVN